MINGNNHNAAVPMAYRPRHAQCCDDLAHDTPHKWRYADEQCHSW